jgi:N-acetylmuramoyl-L-alanine amidase
MLMFRSIQAVLVMLCILLAAAGAVAHSSVTLAFYSDGKTHFVQRATTQEPTPALAVDLLLAGPTAEETAMGVVSAIPEGTSLLSLALVDGRVKVNLSIEAAAGLDEVRSEMIFRQFLYTMRQFGLDSNVRVLVDGKPISDYLPPAPAAKYPASTEIPRPQLGAVGLSGKRITLSPGHGYLWTGTYWATQRGVSCGNPQEDFRNLKLASFLKTFLENDGAYVQPVREHNESRGNGPSGHPWWQEAAYAWLRDAGYSCSVYASSSGICAYEGSVNRSNDDIRSRPLASDLDSRGNTDIYVSIHTNAYNGNCYDSSCPSGTDVYYMNDGEHAAWGPASVTLAQILHDDIISAIQSSGEKRADGIDWGCHGSCSAKYGNFGEIRIPDRPAALLELGFHDSCVSDAPKMEQPFFQSVAMWGMYNGICRYFGNTPTWGMYSAQYVSDNLPSTMYAGEVRSVSITFRNKGVLWDSAHGFKLGAVGDSDPFAGTRQGLGSATVYNNGTFTFTFNFVAPDVPGTYTTDWRMLRENYAWFGDTLTKQVQVLPGGSDTQPPTVPGGFQAEGTDYNTAHLSWTASTDNVGVELYQIRRNGVNLTTVPYSQTYFDDSGLSQNTDYTYQVRAKDYAGNYSEWSSASVARTWAIVAQDSFADLNQWTPAQVADGTIRGVTLDTTVGSDLVDGSGPPSARADVGSSGSNGSFSYLGFPASFAVGYIQCSFRDTSTSNNSRQGIAFRKYSGTSPRLVYFLGLDSSLGYGGYDAEVYGTTAGWVKHQDISGRAVGWRKFKVSVDGANVRFYVDGVLKDTIAEPVEGPEGCDRFYIGHNYNVNQTGWYDDFIGVFPAPPTPTMGTPTGITQNSITWNYTEGNRNWEQGFYIRDTGGVLKATGARNSTSVTESGLPANTLCTRTVSAYNGTLESNPSASASARTLSIPPTTSNISVSPAPQVLTNCPIRVTSSTPFGAGGVEYYRYEFDQSPTRVWTGTEPMWTGGDLEVSATNGGSNWYLHLKGYNASGVANGTLDLGPFYYSPDLRPKELADGTSLKFCGKVVSAAYSGAFYVVEIDRVSGIKVVSGTAVQIGDTVDVTGTMQTAGGERYIQATSVAVH